MRLTLNRHARRAQQARAADAAGYSLGDVQRAVEELRESAANLVLIYRAGGITKAQHEQFAPYFDQLASQLAPVLSLGEVIRETGETFKQLGDERNRY